MTSREIASILKNYRYRSPNYFFGVWEFTWGYSIFNNKTKSFIQDKKEHIKCKYESYDDVEKILKEQYDFMKRVNSSRVIYPSFEECIRFSKIFPEGKGGPKVKAVYLNMIPIKLIYK